MKNQRQTLLFCCLVFLSIFLIIGDTFSQMTIDKEDYPSKIGTYIVTEDDTAEVVEVDVGLPGENQVWSFQQDIPGILTRQLVVDKNNTPYLEDFPDANMVTRYAGELGFLVHSYYFDDTEGLFYAYQKLTDDSLSILGIGVDSSTTEHDSLYLNFKGPVDLEPDILHFPFPLNYSDSWQTVSHGTVEVDTLLYGIRTKVRTEVNDSVYSIADGWGSIVLPNASYECLRIKSYIFLDEYIYTNGVLLRDRHTRTINYTWVTKEFGIVARIISHSDEPDDNFTEAKQVSRLYMFNPNVNVSLTDTIAAPGDTVAIPVRVSQLADLEIFDIRMDILFETGLVQPLGIETQGTLVELWNEPLFSLTDSGMALNLSGDIPLTGEGVLFFLNLLVDTQAGEFTQTEINVKKILVEHDGPVFAVEPGMLTVAYNYNISGAVKYYSNDELIDNVTVALGDYSTITGEDGDYSFTVVPKGDYILKPEKDDDLKNSISAFDASMILRANVGGVELSPYQKIAADVSGNGSVSAYDASFILRYSVGLVTEFPVGDDWGFVPEDFAADDNNWNTTPQQIEYSPLDESKTEQNFKGIIYGDVSGTWSENGSKLNSLYKAYIGKASLEAGDLSRDAEKIIVPIEITSDCDILSANLEMTFKNQELSLSNLVLNPKAPGLQVEYTETNGTIKIALASHAALNSIENVLSVQFRENALKSGSTPTIEFSNVILNGGLVEAQISNNLITLGQTLPDKIELYQNYPNPFNSNTSITYQIQDRTRVRITVYNTLGQTIKTLKDDYQSSGTYEILWNGKNSRDNDVPSGIYFYELEITNSESIGIAKRDIRKMLLIR